MIPHRRLIVWLGELVSEKGLEVWKLYCLINSITYVLTQNNSSTGTSIVVCDKYHLMPALKIEKG